MSAGTDAVAQAVEALGGAATDEEVIDVLDAACVALVGDDLVHRLVPHADRLARLDYRGHGRAALPGGVAICAIDRPLGRAVLSAGRIECEKASDRQGAALGAFLEGLQDLGEGNLEGASHWWREARSSGDPSLGAARLALAHLSLGEFGRGRLAAAVTTAEEALWAAEDAGDARTEALASLYLGLFHCYTGRFRRMDHLLERASLAMDRIEPANRYELPLLHLERGFVAAVRGEFDAAGRAFDQGLQSAADFQNRWYEAIGLAARSEFMAEREPARAARDVAKALTYLDPIDESWWSRFARLSAATVHLLTGNVHAGRRACDALLASDLNPLERGRTLVTRAELRERSGDLDGATTDATDAAALLQECGADWVAARCWVVLSRCDPRRAEYHHRRARQLADPDASDMGWRRLLNGPGTLTIQLLGHINVRIDDRAVPFPTTAAVEVIAMLALADGHEVRTSTIGDRLWPDDDDRRVQHRVDTLIWTIRRSLRPTLRIRRHRGAVSMDLFDHECDVTDLRRQADQLLADPERPGQEARAIAERLREPLLGDLDAPWVVLEQERIERLAHALERLSVGRSAGRDDKR